MTCSLECSILIDIAGKRLIDIERINSFTETSKRSGSIIKCSRPPVAFLLANAKKASQAIMLRTFAKSSTQIALGAVRYARVMPVNSVPVARNALRAPQAHAYRFTALRGFMTTPAASLSEVCKSAITGLKLIY